MKKLLNTLFVTTEDAYLTLDGENVVVKQSQKEIGRFPLHILENIYSYSYYGASPALIGACADRGIGLCFYTPTGRYLARVTGENNGNVLLRREQYRQADDKLKSLAIADNMILGKVYNSRWTIERTIRDYPLRVNVDELSEVSLHLKEALKKIRLASTIEELRGIEGEAAESYFSVFDNLILNQKEEFTFSGRNRRPPLDRVNAALSFAYALLKNQCSSALSSAGLDSYVGFMHVDRSGRESLALDLMEELRAPIADRFVVSMINQKMLKADDFQISEDGAVLLNKEGRKVMIKNWQEHGKANITHPYLKEKMAWGLIPSIQAILLTRYLRNDIDGYPPFLWK
jgi:CRISPR-associated protein Cas1